MHHAELFISESIKYLKRQSINGGFAPWEGAKPNAMTTAEVISALCDVGHPWGQVLIPEAAVRLLEWQNVNGSWTDPNTDNPWDVSSTAWSICALMKSDKRKFFSSCSRGVKWLCYNILPKGGLPTNSLQEVPNTYATAYGFLVLRAFNKKSESESCLKFLIDSQNKDGGWGLYAGDVSESTLTAYVLHGLLDGGMPIHYRAASRGLSFLKKAQAPDGTWGSWLNEVRSVEGTSFSILILCKAKQVENVDVLRSINFLEERFANGSPWILDGTNQIWIAVSTLLVGNALLKYWRGNE